MHAQQNAECLSAISFALPSLAASTQKVESLICKMYVRFVFRNSLCAGLWGAVATTVETSVVKRVLEAYAACAIQLAELVKKREVAGRSGDGESEVDALQKGSELLHAQGTAAQAASTKNVLAAKWLPP